VLTNPLPGRLRISDVEMSSHQQRRSARPAAPGPGSDDLAGLLTLVARGDADAYDAVYDQVSPAVYGTVRRVLRDPTQSEEVAQEVLIQIWRDASRYDPAQGSPAAWIFTIAHRRAVDRVRSNQRATDRQARTVPLVAEADPVADTVEVDLDHQRVRRCLATLSELQREAIVLAYYRGYSYSEVAGLLGVPSGTIKTRMRDGLIRLRDCLGIDP
jgi:RNA polymerase sigma-70 factor (ECF subfamily)